MRSIAFLSQKGGSGKTTLAVHIAVAAQGAGERVVLIDTDPQSSALAWAQARKAEHPSCTNPRRPDSRNCSRRPGRRTAPWL